MLLTMNEFELRDIFALAGDGISRFKINSIIYLVQEIINPFTRPWEFDWKYGVWSSDVHSSIVVAKVFRLLKEDYKFEGKYLVEYIKANDMSDPTPLAHNEKLQELVSYLNEQDNRLLDVASCIVWFENEGLCRQEVLLNLNDFKGHLKNLFNKGFELVETSRKNMVQYK